VEHLCALAYNPIVRIGFSATQWLIEEIGRLLVRSKSVSEDNKPGSQIVNAGHARTICRASGLPKLELGSIASHEMQGEGTGRGSRLGGRP
jgi:Lhr-like helicase